MRIRLSYLYYKARCWWAEIHPRLARQVSRWSLVVRGRTYVFWTLWDGRWGTTAWMRSYKRGIHAFRATSRNRLMDEQFPTFWRIADEEEFRYWTKYHGPGFTDY